ncbi:MAG: ATP-binding protein [Polyangiaceae bacterium]
MQIEEQEEKEHARFLRQVIDHVAHPIFVKDREGRWVFVNRAFCDLLGASAESILGKTDYDFLPKAEADFFHARDIGLLAGDTPLSADETPYTDKRGVRHAIVSTKVPIFGLNGEVTHLACVIHDVTDLKAAQDALHEVNAQLERRVDERSRALADAQLDLVRKERLTAIGALAGGVAHEIRNPLTAIKNAAYVLERQLGKNVNAEAQQALAIVHDEVGRANHIVGELLDYARVREPERRRVQLGGLISAALKASDVPPTVVIVVDAAVADVMVDATQVEAALSNVIRNSIEAMHGKGEITFETRSNADLVTVSIRDSGAGVSSEIEGRLFEPLVTTKSSGLGLGLVTARTLVERQGGTLVYRSEVKPGACFEIALPRAQ